MDRQPVLDGDRLLLRPLAQDDWNALYAVARDPLIWEQHPARDRWQEPVFRAFFADALAQGGALAVIEKGTRAVIGSSRWQGFDPDRSIVEIGWTFLARGQWGGACNRELKRLMLSHAFRWVGTVEFLVAADNFRSRRAMEKIGGRLVESPRFRRPVSAPHVIYEVTRETFEAGPLA
jgi:RimJ/RimL family protein N-acetyltransferase